MSGRDAATTKQCKVFQICLRVFSFCRFMRYLLQSAVIHLVTVFVVPIPVHESAHYPSTSAVSRQACCDPVRVPRRILPYQQRLLRVHAFLRVRHCTNHDMPHVVVSRCRIRFTGQRKQCHATLKTWVDPQSMRSGECSCGEMASCKHKHWCGVSATNGCECASNGVLRGGDFY